MIPDASGSHAACALRLPIPEEGRYRCVTSPYHTVLAVKVPAAIAQTELPPLFVIGAQGDAQLVNYRFRAPYYVVDRLFGAAELRLGGGRGQVVRIERTDRVAMNGQGR